LRSPPHANRRSSGDSGDFARGTGEALDPCTPCAGALNIGAPRGDSTVAHGTEPLQPPGHPMGEIH